LYDDSTHIYVFSIYFTHNRLLDFSFIPNRFLNIHNRNSLFFAFETVLINHGRLRSV